MKITYTLLVLTLSIALNTKAQNVGINTDGSDPDANTIVHIKNDANSSLDSALLRIENEKSTTGTGVQIHNSGQASTTAQWDIIVPGSSTDLRIKGNGSDHVTIQNDGDVGIGTTSPASGLDVQTSMGYSVRPISNNAVLGDNDLVVLCDNGTPGDYTVTLPAAVPDNQGRVYYIKNIGNNVITIDGNTTNIEGAATYELSTINHVVQIISDGTEWHIIEEANNNAGTITGLTCGSSTDNGTLQVDVAASGVSSDVPYTGGNNGDHNGQTVASTGVTGLTATLTAGSFACGSDNLTYNITGTPTSSGTATFALDIGGQTCTLTRTVNTAIASLDCAGATDNGTLTDGEAASGVNSVISYTGGNGAAHSGQTVASTGVTGLTATLSAGTFASGAGTLTYTITGTPSGSGTASFAINIGGQTCTLDRTVDSSDPCDGVSSVTFTYNGSSVTYGTVASSGRCWLDRNLGATQVATSLTDYLSYGDLFQWGRADDGHQLITWTNSTTGTAVNGTTFTLSTTDSPGNSDFILNSNNNFDWRSPQNSNLWQGVSGTNNPCPSGWRLPTENELNAESLTWSSSDLNGAFASPLKISAAGRRYGHSNGNAEILGQGSFSIFWTSSISGSGVESRRFNIFSSSAGAGNYGRVDGFSVRCIKD